MCGVPGIQALEVTEQAQLLEHIAPSQALRGRATSFPQPRKPALLLDEAGSFWWGPVEAGGLVGVVQLFDGRRRVGVADRLVAQALQDGAYLLQVADPLAETLFFHLVHGSILPQAVPCG